MAKTKRPAGKVSNQPDAVMFGSQWRSILAFVALFVSVAFLGIRSNIQRKADKQVRLDSGKRIHDELEGQLSDMMTSQSDLLESVSEALFPDAPNGADKVGVGLRKSAYADPKYWNERYARSKQDVYDWYGTSWNGEGGLQKLKPFVLSFFPANISKILNIGCGNSRFSEELADDGYQDVIAIDISQTVIDKMSKKFAARQGLTFLQMDAANMSFENHTFDLVVEKGTLDALYAGNSALVSKVIPEVFRILRPGAVFASFTFGKPDSRTELNISSWESFQSLVVPRVGMRAQSIFTCT